MILQCSALHEIELCTTDVGLICMSNFERGGEKSSVSVNAGKIFLKTDLNVICANSEFTVKLN